MCDVIWAQSGHIFSGYALNAKGTTVFDKLCVWNGLLKKETLLRAESAYDNKKIKKRQSTSRIHDPRTVHVDSRSVTSNNVILSKMIVVIEKNRIREIHNISNCSFGTIHRIIHTELTIRCPNA